MHSFRQALKLFLLLSLLTGVIYPLTITLIAQLAFAYQANGSFVNVAGKTVGSHLIGQKFEQPQYFWPRPSAVDYGTMPSDGSQLGPTSTKLRELVRQRRDFLVKAHGRASTEKVPSDLLFASGSGLDPDITLKGAYFQAGRVAKARGLPEELLNELIKQQVVKHNFGPPRVNVLQLNMALDALSEER